MRDVLEPNSNSSSGLKGAYPHENGGFRSFISVDGKLEYIGYFDSAEEAHEAWKKRAEQRGKIPVNPYR